MSYWDAVVLDLDDTLLDTTGLLVPVADRHVARVLGLDPAAAARELAELRATGVRRPIHDLARRRGLGRDLAAAAEDAWFDFEVPPLELAPEVSDTLDRLADRAPLALLTQGMPRTQRAKIEGLDLARRFVECVIVPRAAGESKGPHLDRLLRRHRWRPERVVVAGDRLASDVRAANQCGCRAVHVRRGEGAADRPEGPDDLPWATVDRIESLPDLLARPPTTDGR